MLASLAAILAFFVVSAAAQPGSGNIKLRNTLDYDHDGRADLTIFRPSNNTWYVNKSNGGFLFQTFGLSNEDFITPGDYDGDGIADVAVWRDTKGVFYRLNSSTNTVSATQFGLTGDDPVPRDYDGDGKTDLAVVRRTNGRMTWYILGSIDGKFSSIQFGLATDFVAPGDYDGDGKFDIAVQRPGATPTSQAFFYIRRQFERGRGYNSVGLQQRSSRPGRLRWRWQDRYCGCSRGRDTFIQPGLVYQKEQ